MKACLLRNQTNFLNFGRQPVRQTVFGLGLILALGFGAVGLPAAAQVAGPNPVLHIAADQVVAQVSPVFSGMMTEEINHSYDGGLYAELIQNRVFKDNPDQPAHWSLVQADGTLASMSLDVSNALNEQLIPCLRLQALSASAGHRVGAANSGFWGIPVKPDTQYHASFYAKAAAGFSGPITITIESLDGAIVFATGSVDHLTGDWQKYSVTLTTAHDVAPTASARFVLAVTAPGTLWFNLVSLFPPTWHDRPNGNRIDLMQKLADMKPGFLRFPGGNFLEGDSIAHRFPWKQTLGDLSQRPGHPGCWGYRASDGLGLLEFLEWAEDLDARPVLAVYAGFSLPPQRELIKAGPGLAPFVQDALDEIEYVIGDTSTKWGARRAADGHPAPFKLDYIEIGNEDWFDETGSYDGRFAQFYDAIKAKYPQLKCISTVGNEQPAEKRVHSRVPDALDEHYYRSAADFEQEAPIRFDQYSRTGPKIFVGEWAAYEDVVPWDPRAQFQPPVSSLKAALGDAAWMLAMERNSDIIVMQCYAPMLVNVNPGARQWRPDLIGYDALTSFGSPSYYVTVMLNANRGDVVVKASLSGPTHGKVAPLDYSVTKDTSNGTLYIKVVNVTGMPQTLQFAIDGVNQVMDSGTSVVLKSADLHDSNSLINPVNVLPVTQPLTGLGQTFTQTLAPYSVNVLKVATK
jgi:alpha-N-arabinofuranosidase